MSEEWRPGSFTKNFSWGRREDGLRRLHSIIRLGFANEARDVTRDDFRERVSDGRSDYVALNFFLFNRIINRRSYIVADELVYQAITADFSARFNKLALLALNLSLAGRWVGADMYQRRPALWAKHYILDRVAKDFNWKTFAVTADDIERFVLKSPLYKARTARKLATNLYYLYVVGGLSDVSSRNVDRWWVDAVFLALDRLIEDRGIDGITVTEDRYDNLLTHERFLELSGGRSLEKALALKHLVKLYIECGGRNRFSEDHTKERMQIRLPELRWHIANDSDTRPQGAIHPTNPHILKTIPRACAMLARYAAGFEILSADDLIDFDVSEFVRRRTELAVDRLRESQVVPTMTAEQLLRMTRGE